MNVGLIIELIQLILKIIKAWQDSQPKTASASGSVDVAVVHLEKAAAALKTSA